MGSQDEEAIRQLQIAAKRWRPTGACEFHGLAKLRSVEFPPAALQRIAVYLVHEVGLSEEELNRRRPMQCTECNYAVAPDLWNPIDPIALPWKVGEDMALYPADDYTPPEHLANAARGVIRPDQPLR